MKAVIMAGGEGTRLRPLTSNAPKPMLPLANRPMMEHIIDLLKRHGFDEIVVTVAFLANAIRTYFGDGSEFGVSMVYADEPTPLGTAGSVRNAMEHARRALPRHLRRRAHRHRPRRKIVAFHDERKAMATIGLVAVDNPLEFGIVITREDGTHRALPREADVGPGVQRHHQHRHLRARAGDLRLHRPEAGRSTSPARSSPRCWPTASRCTARSPRATGRTSARSRPTSAPTRTCSTGRSRVDIPGFRDRRRRVAGRGRRGLARRPDRRPGGHRRRLPDRGRLPRSASTRCSAPTSGSAPTPTSSAPSSTTTPTSAPASRLRGTVIGRASDLRANVRCDEGVVLGDECFVGDNAVHQRRRQGVPVQDGRGRRRRQLLDRLGEPRAPAACSAATACPGLANVDITPELAARVAMAYGTHAAEGHDGRHVARLQPRRPGC